MTHKETVDAVRLSLLLADTRADRRLGIPRTARPVPAPTPAYHYVLPTVIPTPPKNAGAEEGYW